MKVFNPQHSMEIPDELKKSLYQYREQRKFNAKLWCDAKAYILNRYMENAKLNTAVIAVSGGVDSALVLALVKHASVQHNSPIKKIVAVSLPALENSGATGQEDAYQRALQLCNSYGIKLSVINVSPIQNEIITLAQEQLSLSADDWARGQTVAYARTPILYGITSILSSNGYSSIICGTTNRDEGAYLGYVGKASDGMVDVQLISDLHKSEVYASAQYLNVPEIILNATCTGDMFDGRTDAQVFGASYDFVELYLWYLNLSHEKQVEFKNQLNSDNKEAFDNYASNLENLHRYNSHKYLAGSPAVHLDILESNVRGGWQIQKNKWLEQLSLTPDINQLNKLQTIKLKNLENDNKVTSNLIDIGLSQVQVLDKVLKPEYIDDILLNIDKLSPISINENGSHQLVEKEYIGKSKRLNIYNVEFAQYLWEQIKHSLNPIEFYNEYSYCEVHEDSYWKPVGINPYMKINQYESGGLLVPHYDSAYEYNKMHKNMKTFIIYLENNRAQTRILNDSQNDIPYIERDLKDWESSSLVMQDKILLKYGSKKNTALIFDNKLLHDATQVTSGRKTILITEIVYEKL